MSEDEILYYLIAFILGWLASGMMGNGHHLSPIKPLELKHMRKKKIGKRDNNLKARPRYRCAGGNRRPRDGARVQLPYSYGSACANKIVNTNSLEPTNFAGNIHCNDFYELNIMDDSYICDGTPEPLGNNEYRCEKNTSCYTGI